ncbi:MAG: metallopeptidase TldD-related protein [Pseudobdellovibrio sp.]
MKTDLLTYLKKLSSAAFNILASDEDLAINLHSEQSDFIRFSQSKVRQNTTVQQHEVTLQYQKNQRSYSVKFNLSLNFDLDIKKVILVLEQLRIELPLTDPNPQFVAMTNNGTSETFKKSERPSTPEIIAIIGSTFADSDLAGLWCSGPLRQASLNSKGQFHYFETDYFFFDYSIYDGPRAAKSFYAEDHWEFKNFLAKAQQAKNTLALLKKPALKIKPSEYKTFLGPMAVSEMLGIFYWRALSRSSYEQGFAPLKKLVEKEMLLSEKFSLKENFNLGYSTPFNSSGEISPIELSLIKNGHLDNFLISTQTATEYKLTSNFADTHESMRSPEIRAGTLKEEDILKQLGTGLYLSNLHYINWSDVQTARITGMTRFACFWVENGEIQGPIQDLRFDDSLFNLFGKNLIDFTENQQVFTDTATYLKRSLGAMKVPGMLLKAMNFTL